MMGLVGKLVLAVVVGVVVFLLATLFGNILQTIGVPIADTIGAFLVRWAGALGVLAALWYFFAGGGFGWPIHRP